MSASRPFDPWFFDRLIDPAFAKQFVPPSVADLRRLAHHNPLVRAWLTAWETGGYPSLESALVGLVCALAEQNERLLTATIERERGGPSLVNPERLAAWKESVIASCGLLPPRDAGEPTPTRQPDVNQPPDSGG